MLLFPWGLCWSSPKVCFSTFLLLGSSPSFFFSAGDSLRVVPRSSFLLGVVRE